MSAVTGMAVLAFVSAVAIVRCGRSMTGVATMVGVRVVTSVAGAVMLVCSDSFFLAVGMMH